MCESDNREGKRDREGRDGGGEERGVLGRGCSHDDDDDDDCGNGGGVGKGRGG